jgi:hypothetical protein
VLHLPVKEIYIKPWNTTHKLSGMCKVSEINIFNFQHIIPNNCLLYTNICTNKYCKFILNYSDMFRC